MNCSGGDEVSDGYFTRHDPATHYFFIALATSATYDDTDHDGNAYRESNRDANGNADADCGTCDGFADYKNGLAVRARFWIRARW